MAASGVRLKCADWAVNEKRKNSPWRKKVKWAGRGAGVSVFRCFGVSVFRCFGVSVALCARYSGKRREKEAVRSDWPFRLTETPSRRQPKHRFKPAQTSNPISLNSLRNLSSHVCSAMPRRHAARAIWWQASGRWRYQQAISMSSSTLR